MDKEIIEGNLLIAAFMGAHINDNEKYLDGIRYMETIPLTDMDVQPFGGSKRDFIGNEFLKYHTSYDWLMPVWNKISAWGKSEFGIHWSQEINETSIIISTTKSKKFEIVNYFGIKKTLEIENLFTMVIQFIKWYNSKTQTNA